MTLDVGSQDTDAVTGDPKRQRDRRTQRRASELKPHRDPEPAPLTDEDRAKVVDYWRLAPGVEFSGVAPAPMNEFHDRLSSFTNRIAPLVCGARVLAVGASETGSMPVDELMRRASEVARLLAVELRHEDRKAGRKGVDKWSVGWPAGKDPEKSLGRYRRYFLLERRGADLVGPFLDLGMCVVSDDSVRPTARCAAIARASSGVFGESDELLTGRQQSEFIEALVAMGGEWAEISRFLEATSSGPSIAQLEETIQRHYQDWSPAQVTAQRAALLGRLYQLGLVEMITDGDLDVYRTTKLGRETLEKIANDWR